MNLIKTFWELPPKTVARKAKHRILRRSGREPDLDDLLESPKHMRPQRFYDFLSRYEAILARSTGWAPLEFENRNVLEIGCGPLMGWGPLAVFLGCRRYLGIEPQFDRRILEDEVFVRRYFLPMFKDLTAIYGHRYDFDQFLEALETQTDLTGKHLVDLDGDSTFDVVLSNSCLEHVTPFEESIARLKEVSAPGSRFLHLVDFGNHRPTPSPFSDLYEVKPDRYFATYGQHINLLRPPDIVEAFCRNGFDAHLEPYYAAHEGYDGDISAYWLEHYRREDLFLKTGLVHGEVALTQIDSG